MRKFLFLVTSIILLTGALSQASAQPELPPGDNPPPTVFSRVSDTGTAVDFDSAAYAIVFDSTCTRIDSKGVAKTDSYKIYKALTDEGCKELSVLNWRYEPLSSYVEIREVNVIRDSIAIPVSMADLLDVPAPQSMIYWGDRLKMLQLPRLQPGDGIEVKMYRKGYSYALLDNVKLAEPSDERYVPPMAGEYFDIVLFESEAPIVEKIYVLEMPKDKRIHSQIYNGPMYSSTTYKDDITTYAWWIKDVPAWEMEDDSPDEPDVLTKVVIATVESWEAKSRWFFEVNEPQFAFTPAIKAKVDEILKNAGVANGTPSQKGFELLHWVAQNIRYSGQTMGEGEGYTLHSGAMIFEQRSGVCKDIAGMLITMMRAAGLDSYGAMTMAGSHIEDLPADQFNHCVVALHQKDGSYEMYDPTWVGFNRDIWSKYETEQDYLLGTPKGEKLRRIAYSPAEESPIEVNNKCRILADGTLEGTINLKADGANDGRLRGFDYWYKKSDSLNAIARMLGTAGESIEILSIDHGDIYDFYHPMWWEIQYRIPGYAMKTDDAYEFKSPMLTMTAKSFFRDINTDWAEERNDDIFFYNTTFLNASEEIQLPGGYKLAKAITADSLDETYASVSGIGEMKGDKLAVTEEVKIKRRQIPPDGYEGFRKVMNSAKKYSDSLFRAEKGGK